MPMNDDDNHFILVVGSLIAIGLPWASVDGSSLPVFQITGIIASYCTILFIVGAIMHYKSVLFGTIIQTFSLLMFVAWYGGDLLVGFGFAAAIVLITWLVAINPNVIDTAIRAFERSNNWIDKYNLKMKP